MGCPWAAHSSNLGFTFWNRILLPKHMNIYGPFHTNWDCFYSPKTEQVGCPRAAHSSFIGSSVWNRISYLFTVSYSSKQNLMHKFQPNSPHQFLDVHGLSRSLKKFPQFGLMFWDRSNGPFPAFFISSMHFNA